MGRLAQELLEAARRVASALSPPPVARVFVPGRDLGPQHHGSFCVVELADGSTGVAYILLGDTRDRLRAVDTSTAAGREAIALAEAFTHCDTAERALGLVAMN